MAPRRLLLEIIFFVLLWTGSASSTLSSVVVFHSRESTGRNLLQTSKNCPIDFEYKNYTVITSQCKATDYVPELCCKAFKEFACPYADELNDARNDCAKNMFSYIDIHGNYTAGVFSSFCREGKDGLDCPASPPQPANTDASYAQHHLTPSVMMLLIVIWSAISCF